MTIIPPPPLPSAADLRADAAQRWQQLTTDRPDLVPAIDLQRRLLSRVLDTVDLLRSSPRIDSGAWLAESGSTLDQGTPLLVGGTAVAIEPSLVKLVPEFRDALASGGAGDA